MNEKLYYSRQTCLPEVGLEGQKKLSAARCLVIGAGGLGSPALLYLAAAGIGTLGICDFDRLDISNLHRQPLYSSDEIGSLKAELAAKRLKTLNPMIRINTHPVRFTAQNAQELFASYDLILDCTDNFSSKFLINDSAFLYKKPLVRAGIYRFEGYLQFYLPERGDACLRCHWKEVPQEGCVGSCQEVGVLGPLPGFFGTLQAMEAIKYFLGLPLLGSSELLLVDLLTHSQKKILQARSKDCVLCGSHPRLLTKQVESWSLEADQLDEQALQEFILVDLREGHEVERDPFTHAPHLLMPLSTFTPEHMETDRKHLFFCHRGARSARLAAELTRQGVHSAFSLAGGKQALDSIFQGKKPFFN